MGDFRQLWATLGDFGSQSRPVCVRENIFEARARTLKVHYEGATNRFVFLVEILYRILQKILTLFDADTRLQLYAEDITRRREDMNFLSGKNNI